MNNEELNSERQTGPKGCLSMATAQVSECLALLKEIEREREFYSKETKSSHNGLCEVAGVWTPVCIGVHGDQIRRIHVSKI